MPVAWRAKMPGDRFLRWPSSAWQRCDLDAFTAQVDMGLVPGDLGFNARLVTLRNEDLIAIDPRACDAA